MSDYTIKPLSSSTWDDFAQLVERQGTGKMGAPGCWCINCHPRELDVERTAAARRALKEQLVADGRAHAALVYDGNLAVGWCQYGPPDELPQIHHRKDYVKGLVELPDYRITCIFVDKAHGKQGVAAAALQGALELIAAAGGGVVEGYPHDVPDGKRISPSFLYNLTRDVYEQAGFTYQRPKGAGNCVMVATIDPA